MYVCMYVCMYSVDGLQAPKRAENGCGAAGPAWRRGAICLFICTDGRIYPDTYLLAR